MLGSKDRDHRNDFAGPAGQSNMLNQSRKNLFSRTQSPTVSNHKIPPMKPPDAASTVSPRDFSAVLEFFCRLPISTGSIEFVFNLHPTSGADLRARIFRTINAVPRPGFLL